jgi:hypothetical protein
MCGANRHPICQVRAVMCNDLSLLAALCDPMATRGEAAVLSGVLRRRGRVNVRAFIRGVQGANGRRDVSHVAVVGPVEPLRVAVGNPGARLGTVGDR